MDRNKTVQRCALIVTLILAIFLSACAPTPAPPPPPEPEQQEPPPAPPEPQAYPDLIIMDVFAEDQAGSRFLKVSVLNQGQGLAQDVDGECSYECTSSMVKINNQDFLQDGYLVANKTIYGMLGITPCQDSSIYFSCMIDPLNVVIETDESNNYWEGWVSMP